MKANGAAADGVLGQIDFNSNGSGTRQNALFLPLGIFVDSNGRLWVTDTDNNRVLRFDDAANQVDGANANAVLGQTDFTSNLAAVSQIGMNNPSAISGDNNGRLYVSDGNNYRVLWFDNAASKANGGLADGVLGQAGFTTNAGGTTATSLQYPMGIFYDPTGDVLWAADMVNSRVLLYGTVPAAGISLIGNGVAIPNGSSVPSLANGTDFGSLALGHTLTQTFTISNTGVANLSLSGIPAVSISGAAAGDFAVVRLPASPVVSNGATIFKLTFTPSATGARTATLTIANNTVNNNPYTFAIQGTGTNQPPVANAGLDQTVNGGATVQLNGSGSYDPDGQYPLTYHWAQTGGPMVTLSSTSVVSPTFTAPATPSVLTFTLSVTDSYGLPSLVPDTVVITVNAPEINVLGNGVTIPNGSSIPSLANGTDFGSLALGHTVTHTFTISNTGTVNLSLSGIPAVSISGAAAGDFAVVQLPASPVVSNGATIFKLTFTPSATGARTATLTIANNTVNNNPYTFAIQGTGTNQPPVANAGVDQTVNGGATVQLNGSGSYDPDGHYPLTYHWAQTGGPMVTLSSTSVVSPTFTAPATPSVLTFTLSVTDSYGLPSLVPDTVVITVNAPEINVLGNGVTIPNGSSIPSLANGTDFGSLALGHTVTHTFTISNTGSANLILNGTPVVSITGAAAGDFAVVQLPATSVGPNHTTTFKVTFTPTVTGARTATLTIANNTPTDNPYTFAIQGTGTNQPPVANAGLDQTVNTGSLVQLNGSSSYDSDGHYPLAYHWAQTGGPMVTLSSASVVSPTFAAPTTQTVLTFTLSVTDSYGLPGLAPDTVVISIMGTPGYGSLPGPGSTINVGKVLVGSTVTTTITISETGNAPLIVTSTSLSGTSAAEFSVSSNGLTILDGGAPQKLTIRCTPTGLGLRTATLTINHNAPGSPATYTLNCTGLANLYLPLVFK